MLPFLGPGIARSLYPVSGLSGTINALSQGVGGGVLPPLPATNLAEHYIAGTGVSDTADAVDSWADQSGNGYVATGTTTTRPTKATDLNGNPIICFPYRTSGSASLVTNGPAYSGRAVSIWIVARLNTISGPLAFVNGYGGGAAHLRVECSDSITPQMYAVSVASGRRAPINKGVYGVIAGAASTIMHDRFGSSSVAAVTNDATNTGGITISGTGGFMDLYEVIVYSAAQSADDQAAVKAYLVAKYGLSTVAPSKLVVFEGDSLTAGNLTTLNRSTAFQLACDADIAADWLIYRRGVSGNTLTNLTARATSLDGYLADAQTTNLLLTEIGANDMASSDGPTFYSALDTYLSARVGAGWTSWDATNTAINNATRQGRIDAANALRRSSLAADAGVAQIVDYAALPEFDQQADAGVSPPYIPADGTHLDNSGHALKAGVVKPLLMAA